MPRHWCTRMGIRGIKESHLLSRSFTNIYNHLQSDHVEADNSGQSSVLQGLSAVVMVETP